MQTKTEKMALSPMALSPDELCPLLGISRPVAYELCKRADFPAIRISPRRIIIPLDALQRWLDNQASEKNAVVR